VVISYQLSVIGYQLLGNRLIKVSDFYYCQTMSDSPYCLRSNFQNHGLWAGKAPILSHLDLELTERCNNDCIHCNINRPEGDEEAKGRELTRGEWQEILKEAAGLGAWSVRFTGGEPLLREDFEELYLFARKLGLRVQLFTNGRLITPRLADLFARIPPLERIEITVYGMRVESYEAVSRRPGSYAEFRRGLGLLLERKIPLAVKWAWLPPNQKELAEFEAWAGTLAGAEGPAAATLLFDLRGRRDSEARNRTIRRVRPAPEQVIQVWNRLGDYYRKEMDDFCREFLEPPADRLFTCGAGRQGCVDPYGIYQPCLLLRDPALGYKLEIKVQSSKLKGGKTEARSAMLDPRSAMLDARSAMLDARPKTEDGDQRSEKAMGFELSALSFQPAPLLPPASSLQPPTGLGGRGSLRAALKEFFPKLRETRAGNPEYLRRCARCSLRGLCEQCPARSWAEHGTLDTPVEYLCEVAHAQARDLGMLREGEMGWEK
jgi:MoaA/NifB/PqqE/SkfB family radical SAM enzyme